MTKKHPLFPRLFLNFHSTGQTVCVVQSIIGPTRLHSLLVRIWPLFSVCCCFLRCPSVLGQLLWRVYYIFLHIASRSRIYYNCVVVAFRYCLFGFSLYARHFCEFANFFFERSFVRPNSCCLWPCTYAYRSAHGHNRKNYFCKSRKKRAAPLARARARQQDKTVQSHKISDLIYCFWTMCVWH